MTSRLRPLFWPFVVILLAIGAYALLRSERGELVDFAVPRTAAQRALAAEPLYRPDDGHFQYKYLPAFAIVMIPFAPLPKALAEAAWFALTVAMAWAFVKISLRWLPDRRSPAPRLIWITLLLNGKFLVKELAFGQFNLPLALLLMAVIGAANRRRGPLAAALTGAAVFVKPYALVMVPWLLWTQGWRVVPALLAVLAAGLALPAVLYGWDGNLLLLQDWYATVAETTAPNLLSAENVSFASLWTKWIGDGPTASGLALLMAVAALGLALVVVLQRRPGMAFPEYLEGAYLLLLIPLLSPQGWDYVLLLALPGYMCLVDRWKELRPPWRAAAATGFVLTSFTVFDLLGRQLYTQLMLWSAASVGAVLVGLALARLRRRGLA